MKTKLFLLTLTGLALLAQGPVSPPRVFPPGAHGKNAPSTAVTAVPEQDITLHLSAVQATLVEKYRLDQGAASIADQLQKDLAQYYTQLARQYPSQAVLDARTTIAAANATIQAEELQAATGSASVPIASPPQTIRPPQ